MARTLCASINTSKGNARTQLAVNTPAALLHVWARLMSNNVRWVADIVCHDKRILDLLRICRCRSECANTRRRRGIGCVGALRGSKVVLKEEVVFVRNTANSPEYSALHEVIGVRAEAVNDVMVVPDVDLWNLAVRSREGALAIPPDVVVEVVLVAVIAHLLAEGILAALVWVANGRPFLERAIDTHSIVVDLVASTNHDMERPLLVHAEDVVPKRRSRPGIDISTHTETVAGVEHDAHRLRSCGYNEHLRLLRLLAINVYQVSDIVLPS
jgi:hypothetical protein